MGLKKKVEEEVTEDAEKKVKTTVDDKKLEPKDGIKNIGDDLGFME